MRKLFFLIVAACLLVTDAIAQKKVRLPMA